MGRAFWIAEKQKTVMPVFGIRSEHGDMTFPGEYSIYRAHVKDGLRNRFKCKERKKNTRVGKARAVVNQSYCVDLKTLVINNVKSHIRKKKPIRAIQEGQKTGYLLVQLSTDSSMEA